MANNTILRLKNHGKVFHVLSLFTFLLLVMQRVGAVEFKVGDANGWTVPTDSNVSYNQWAETKRFQIGDSLLFVYSAEKDSVLNVNKEEYNSCNSASPIASFKDGNTKIMFDKNGFYYFISGVPENCKKNEKLVVVVMVDRSNRSSTTNQKTATSPPLPPSDSTDNATALPPPPSNSTDNATAPPPFTEITPPPSEGEAPPAPSPVSETVPSTPGVVSPSPNRASVMSVSAIASIAAFAGSSLLLVM